MKLLNKTVVIGVVIIGLCLAVIVKNLIPTQARNGFDVGSFGKIAVQEGGRVKPLDTVARNRLMMISGKQSLREGGRKISAIEIGRAHV